MGDNEKLRYFDINELTHVMQKECPHTSGTVARKHLSLGMTGCEVELQLVFLRWANEKKKKIKKPDAGLLIVAIKWRSVINRCRGYLN